jgi:PAS domain S-box-containing protein
MTKGMKLLLIEDTASDADIFVEFASMSEEVNLHVDVAPTLAAAKSSLRNDTYDVIFTDLSLPDSFGMETVQYLARAHAHTPVVVLSGLCDKDVALNSLRDGAQDYLFKDNLSPETLVRSARYAMERSKLSLQLKARCVEAQQWRQHMVAALSSINDGFFELNRHGQILFANRPALNMFGIVGESYVGEYFHDLLETDCTRCELDQALRDCIPTRAERVLQHNMTVEIQINPFNTDFLEGTGFVVTVHDISERKAAQKRMSEFYSVISHELRTPLTATYAAIRLLTRHEFVDAEAQELLDISASNCQRSITLIGQILDLKKIESGHLAPQYSEFDCVDLMSSVCNDLRAFAEESGLRLHMQPTEPLKISADRGQMVQALVNLTGNAIKFSQAGGVVTLNCRRSGSMVRIEVTDCGPGIAEEDQSKLFSIFGQLDTSDARQKEGSGLGLSIVKAIVEQHQGRVGVESEVGKGSTFWLEIPHRYGTENGSSPKTNEVEAA